METPSRPFSTRRNFPLENVVSMRSSLLFCVKFPQKTSSRRRKEVQNCSTFQHCRTDEKDLNRAVSCAGSCSRADMSLDSSSWRVSNELVLL